MENIQTANQTIPPLLRIPQELLVQIFALLPIDDHIELLKVCSTIKNIILYTPSLQRTRYAVDSGTARVLGSLGPRSGALVESPTSHILLKSRPTFPWSKLLCTSKGDSIDRYAYWTCYAAQPQRGTANENDDVVTEAPTPEDIDAEKDTVTISLGALVYRLNITDITNSSLLDEPFLENDGRLDEIRDITVDVDVFVRNNIFQARKPDPMDWTFRLPLSKKTTVRQLTAMLLREAFRELLVAGMPPDQTAESCIKFFKHTRRDIWVCSIVYYRTSSALQYMVWRPDVENPREYLVTRREYTRSESIKRH